MKIQRNKHPAGRISNMVFGLCSLCDGLVRLMSCGFLHTSLTLDWARYQATVQIRNLRKGLK